MPPNNTRSLLRTHQHGELDEENTSEWFKRAYPLANHALNRRTKTLHHDYAKYDTGSNWPYVMKGIGSG